MMDPDALRLSPQKAPSFSHLPPDVHYVLLSFYLDDYTILSLRHVDHYFYSFQLSPSVYSRRSYATCVAFHRMWEDELLARHGSACAVLALPRPSEAADGQSRCPLTAPTPIYRPARPFIYPAMSVPSGCLSPASHIANEQPSDPWLAHSPTNGSASPVASNILSGHESSPSRYRDFSQLSFERQGAGKIEDL